MTNDPQDLNLAPHEAILREMRSCSYGNGSDFHLIRCIKLMDIREGHDELIRELELRLDHATHPHHRELALEVIESLKRKKAETIRRDGEQFARSLTNPGP